MDDDVRDLGRKARERREVGISKRSAIVRLEAEPTSVEPKKRKSFSLVTASAVPKKKSVRPRKRSAPSKRVAGKSNASPTKQQDVWKARNSEADIDTRTPDISHLTNSNPSQENISNTVRIHGLPVATKRGDMIRFFAGLNPKHIFMLPQNNSPILEWDAAADSDDDDSDDGDSGDDSKETASGRIKRHPNSFRVFVRFDSAPVASLAAQRSGEEIYMGKASDSSNETRRRQGATIAVSQVPKTIAKYLFQNMAVECNTNNLSLQDILADAEQRIHKLVPKILWSAAQHDLGFQVAPKSARQRRYEQQLSYKPFASLQDSKSTTATAGCARQDYTKLAKIHNQLLRDYDSLVTTTNSSCDNNKSSLDSDDDIVDSFPLVALCECPDMLRDPATRLTDSAATLLLEKSQHLDTYLHMARTTLLATTSPCRRPSSTPDNTQDKRYSSVMDRVLAMTRSPQQQPILDETGVPGPTDDNDIAGGDEKDTTDAG